MRNFIFVLIILALSFFIYVYPINLLGYLLFDSKIIEPLSFIPTVIIASAAFLYFRTHSTSRLLRGFIYYGMGLGFIGFCLFNIGLIASMIAPKFTLEIGLGCLILFVFTCFKSILNGRKIHLKHIHFSSPKIKNPHNIIFISDIHLGSNPKSHLEGICEKINGLTYDYLLIGGDLFDSSTFEAEDLEPLKTIQKPILFVTGNHEYYVKNHLDKIAKLIDYNIKCLDNQGIIIDELNIVGISDNQSRKIQSEMAESLVKENKFNVVMVHQPSIWNSAPEGADLILSGHTHNGQIFPFNFLVRLQFSTVYGIYRRLNSNLYVSSGSGTWGPRMRLGTQNEIVQISLSPEKIN
jgi:uncharacterized protein